MRTINPVLLCPSLSCAIGRFHRLMGIIGRILQCDRIGCHMNQQWLTEQLNGLKSGTHCNSEEGSGEWSDHNRRRGYNPSRALAERGCVADVSAEGRLPYGCSARRHHEESRDPGRVLQELRGVRGCCLGRVRLLHPHFKHSG